MEDGFYLSREWRELRYKVISKHVKEYGKVCSLCGITTKILHVDHIYPRSKYPKLALKESNLQVLCEDCNIGKSNKYNDNWSIEKESKPKTILRKKDKLKMFFGEPIKQNKEMVNKMITDALDIPNYPPPSNGGLFVVKTNRRKNKRK